MAPDREVVVGRGDQFGQNGRSRVHRIRRRQRVGSVVEAEVSSFDAEPVRGGPAQPEIDGRLEAPVEALPIRLQERGRGREHGWTERRRDGGDVVRDERLDVIERRSRREAVVDERLVRRNLQRSGGRHVGGRHIRGRRGGDLDRRQQLRFLGACRSDGSKGRQRAPQQRSESSHDALLCGIRPSGRRHRWRRQLPRHSSSNRHDRHNRNDRDRTVLSSVTGLTSDSTGTSARVCAVATTDSPGERRGVSPTCKPDVQAEQHVGLTPRRSPIRQSASRYIKTTARSAGDRPLIRLAWPRLVGRTVRSFSRASMRSCGIAS